MEFDSWTLRGGYIQQFSSEKGLLRIQYVGGSHFEVEVNTPHVKKTLRVKTLAKVDRLVKNLIKLLEIKND